MTFDLTIVKEALETIRLKDQDIRNPLALSTMMLVVRLCIAFYASPRVVCLKEHGHSQASREAAISLLTLGRVILLQAAECSLIIVLPKYATLINGLFLALVILTSIRLIQQCRRCDHEHDATPSDERLTCMTSGILWDREVGHFDEERKAYSTALQRQRVVFERIILRHREVLGEIRAKELEAFAQLERDRMALQAERTRLAWRMRRLGRREKKTRREDGNLRGILVRMEHLFHETQEREHRISTDRDIEITRILLETRRTDEGVKAVLSMLEDVEGVLEGMEVTLATREAWERGMFAGIRRVARVIGLVEGMAEATTTAMATTTEKIPSPPSSPLIDRLIQDGEELAQLEGRVSHLEGAIPLIRSDDEHSD